MLQGHAWWIYLTIKVACIMYTVRTIQLTLLSSYIMLVHNDHKIIFFLELYIHKICPLVPNSAMYVYNYMK